MFRFRNKGSSASPSAPDDMTSGQSEKSGAVLVPATASDGDIREACGFDRNDERVKVSRIPLGGDAPTYDINKLFGDPRVTGPVTDPFAGSDEGPRVRNFDPGDILARHEALTEGEAAPRPETPEQKWVRQGHAVTEILMEVMEEVAHAVRKHEPMHSPHEGISVIREEFEELWAHVKEDTGYTGDAREEALQLAAMAVRYILDLDPSVNNPR